MRVTSGTARWREEMIEANGQIFETAVAGEGPKLAICLHGFPEHFIAWRRQIPMLAARGHQVWAPNMRGYGRSAAPARIRDYHLSQLLGDLAGLHDEARRRGLEPSLLIGHDWGGIVAWSFMLNRIRPFERLIAVNLPHPQAARDGLWRRGQWLRSWYIFFFQLPWAPERLFGRRRGAAVVAEILRTARRPECFDAEMREILERNAARPGGLSAMINYYRANFWELLRGPLFVGEKTLATPTLLLWGRHDAYLGAHLAPGAEAFCTDFTLRWLDASHWAQTDAAEEMNEAIEAWLDRDLA
ncbi:MAG: alpha/beta fold hydrolase [Pseudomonadota bacterium]